MGFKVPFYACYNVLNEEDYIEASIRSVVDVVDKVVVICGATKFAPLHKDGLSVDKTDQILDRLDKTFPGKLEIEEVGVVPHRMALQNAFIDHVPDGAWAMFTGADEIWDPVQLELLRELLEYDGEDLVEVYVNQIELRLDFRHRLPIPFNLNERRFWDRRERPCHNGFIQERIFRRIPGQDVRYRQYHTNVVDRQGRALYADGAYQGRRMFSFVDFYHAGKICSREKLALKQAHIYVQNVVRKPWSITPPAEKAKALDLHGGYWAKSHYEEKEGSKLLPVKRLPPGLAAHKWANVHVKDIPSNPVYAVKV